jgi:hypothetical protein
MDQLGAEVRAAHVCLHVAVNLTHCLYHLG